MESWDAAISFLLGFSHEENWPGIMRGMDPDIYIAYIAVALHEAQLCGIHHSALTIVLHNALRTDW